MKITGSVKLLFVAFVLASCQSDSTGVEYSCASCTVVTDSVLSLTGGPAESDAAPSSVVGRNSRGQYIVARLPVTYLIAIYDSTGHFQRIVGRNGKGPGEFRSVNDIAITRGDSVIVLHDERISIFDPQFNFVRDYPRGRPLASYVGTPDDRSFVIATGLNERGPRIARYSLDGTRGESINGGPYGEWENLGGLSVHGDTVWIVRSDSAVIEELLIGGQSRRAIRYRGKIWDRDVKIAKRDKTRPPMINDIVPSSSGEMWIATISFASGRTIDNRTGGEAVARRLGTAEWMSYAHAILELIDPKTGQSIAGGPTPLGIAAFVDRDHVAALSEDSAGRSVMTIYRMSIKR